MAVTPWMELELEVPVESADDIAGLLVDAGALGAELRTTPDRAHQLIVASYEGATDPAAAAVAARALLANFGVPLRHDIVVRQREDGEWAVRWKDYFAPLQLGRHLWVVPTWVDDFRPPAMARVVRMDPGMAFGTGQHASTAMTWELLEESLIRLSPAERVGAHVLDVGCGTGVLAMGAVALGAGRATAIDNDPIAVQVAIDNALVNGLQAAIEVLATPLERLQQRFAHVVANILAPTIIEMATDLVEHLSPRGQLYLSGILAAERDEVTTAIRAATHRLGRGDLALRSERQREDWVALAFGP
ncbi:MAG: 50S ribosomal protein L11 methyltransferase [Myxococcota bacterium]